MKKDLTFNERVKSLLSFDSLKNEKIKPCFVSPLPGDMFTFAHSDIYEEIKGGHLHEKTAPQTYIHRRLARHAWSALLTPQKKATLDSMRTYKLS
jgi:hypothetical protein